MPLNLADVVFQVDAFGALRELGKRFSESFVEGVAQACTGLHASWIDCYLRTVRDQRYSPLARSLARERTETTVFTYAESLAWAESKIQLDEWIAHDIILDSRQALCNRLVELHYRPRIDCRRPTGRALEEVLKHVK